MFGLTEDYAEQSIQGKPKGASVGVTILAILLAIFGFGFVTVINGMLPEKIAMLGAVLIGIYLCVVIPFVWYVIKKKKVDYDYLYVENDFEVAAIYNGEKRKKLVTVHMEHAKRIAPKGSQAILGYEGKGKVKVRDFTSQNPDITPYVIVVEKDGQVIELLIEPDEHMLQLMRLQNKAIFYDA